MKLRLIWAASVACLLCASFSIAATIKLKDGRTLVGEVKKLGNSYSILMPDGTRSIVPIGEILTIDGKAPGAAAEAPTTSPASRAPSAATGGAFKIAKSKADRADAPIVALQLWDDFIQKNPTSPDLEAAKAERAAWDKLYKDKSEKIKGKWVGGQELKDLKKKCDDLYKEAVDTQAAMGVRGVQGLKKLDEILAIYPRHFGANYEKGYYNLVQAGANRVGSNGFLQKGIAALETTSQIAPTVPEVWSNLAIGYNFRGEYQKSVESAYRAVKIRGEDKELLQTLANALFNAPRNFREVNPKVREINAEVTPSFAKYGITPGATWQYQRPKVGEGDTEPDDVKHTAGVQWSGSGFFVTSDGYIITNHHVAAGDAHKPVPDGISWRIRLDDGTEVPAELIGIDDKADIAVMKVKLPTSNEYLKIATENPEQGAEALVLGYPATGSDEHTLQISKGTVKSIHDTEEYNVWFDLNTTHGNSGGPIVDRDGHVIGILTAGGKVYDMVLTMGVGPNQIETFMAALSGKAPKVEYAAPNSASDGVPLDSQKLTRQCRKSTVLVLAIRGADSSDGDKKSGETTGAEPTPGDEGGNEPPAAGGGKSGGAPGDEGPQPSGKGRPGGGGGRR
jgi:S1-C subfamily serine protease